jgi:hypothetical protein
VLYRVPEARACQTATELRVDQTPDTIILYTEVPPFPWPIISTLVAIGEGERRGQIKNKINDHL